ncbi:hypothetical protein NUSPORA_00027 [Nucleospora cyclopteri]
MIRIKCHDEEKLIAEIKKSVEMNYTVFLYGENGKSTLLKEIYSDLIVVDAREIADPKSLGGFYTILNHEVIFADGILIEAMRKGLKICFKNIENNVSLQQYLIPAIKNTTFMNSKNELVNVHKEFRLFLTAKDSFIYRNVNFIGPILYAKDSFKDKIPIRIIDFIEKNGQENCLLEKGVICNQICLKKIDNCSCNDKFICNRHFIYNLALYNACKNHKNTVENRKTIFQAITNIFLKHKSTLLYEFLYLREEEILLPNSDLALTKPVSDCLDALIHNVNHKIPTLLEGETGSGKTALIQYLSKNSQYFFNKKVELITINMSTDFDGFDLLGGFQSLNVDKMIKEIIKTVRNQFKKAVKLDKSKCKLKVLEDLKKEIENNEIRSYKIEKQIENAIKLVKTKMPFIYKEGILVDAMQKGKWVLLDEINLAGEETTSLIESIATKKFVCLNDQNQRFKIHDDFMMFACMNPYGDFGKKQFDPKSFNKIRFYDFSSRLNDVLQVTNVLAPILTLKNEVSQFYYEFKSNISQKIYTNRIEPVVSGRTFCRSLKLVSNLLNKNNPINEMDAISRSFSLLFFTQIDLHSRSEALSLFEKYIGKVEQNDLFLDQLTADFVVTSKIKVLLKDLKLAVEFNLPVLLQGNTSTGKTSLIKALSTIYNQKVIRINNHEGTETSDFIGRYTGNNSEFYFKKGPLVNAMLNGDWVILDELNLAPSDVLESLNRLLDDNNEVFIPETDEIIKPHKNFRLFATQNISYIGRKGLAKSFRNRFVEILVPDKTDQEVKEIICKTSNLPATFINLMMQCYTKLKDASNLTDLITLRDAIKWARRPADSYKSVFLDGMDLIYERQRSEKTRKIVFDIFNDVFNKKLQLTEKKSAVELLETQNNLIFKDETVLNGIFLTKSFIKLIHLIQKALSNKEPVLLIGETGIGKTRAVEIVAKLFSKNLKTINLSENTETADFLGNFELKEGQIVWKNGILVESLINNDMLLIDEINLAESAVLERLNSVLEDEKSVFIPEIDQLYENTNFMIVSTMNPSGDFGKTELSPAIRSRFTEIYYQISETEKCEIFNYKINQLFADTNDEKFVDLKLKITNLLSNQIKKYSLRKIEIVVEFLRNICLENNKLIRIDFNFDSNFVQSAANECLNLLNDQNEGNQLINKNEQISYNFRNEVENEKEVMWNNKNSRKILRSLTFNKGILLIGMPGTGKTSIVQAIARRSNKKLLRINLSENTEISDLLGSHLPIGNSIKFVPSEFINYIKNGHWIILDEINLCSQSVLEGINSILDYRRKITVNNEVVEVHDECKIFGAMNPSTVKGRKQLPKSFIDRFITVNFYEYSPIEIKNILEMKYGINFKYDDKKTLRGNIRENEIEKIKNYNADTEYENFLLKSYNGNNSYYVDNLYFIINDVVIKYKKLDKNYTIIHSQINSIYKLIKCFLNKIPVIFKGKWGRKPMVKFVSNLLGKPVEEVYCSDNTDAGDLIGSYQKVEETNTNCTFQWKNSFLIDCLSTDSIIIINSPETVDRSIFDRLNCLFESDRTINVYEKGCDMEMKVNENCRIILFVENEQLLSEPLLDRCLLIDLEDHYDQIDVCKINNGGNENPILISRDNSSFQILTQNVNYDSFNLEKTLKFNLLTENLPNLILESEIAKNMQLKRNFIEEIDEKSLKIYKKALKLDFGNFYENLKIFSTIRNFCDFNEENSFNLQFNSKNMKMILLTRIRNKHLKDIPELEKLCNTINKYDFVLPAVEINVELISFLKSISSDPIYLYYKSTVNQFKREENEIFANLDIEFIEIYKYGRRENQNNVKKLLNMIDLLRIKCRKAVENININRKWDHFVEARRNILKCSRFEEILQTFSQIDDFTDLLLPLLINKINEIELQQHVRNIILTDINSFNTISNYNLKEIMCLIKNNKVSKCIKQEYSKNVYNRLIESKIDNTGLILDFLVSTDYNDQLQFCFDDNQLNKVLNQLVPKKIRYKIIETEENKIKINSEIYEKIIKLQAEEENDKIIENLPVFTNLTDLEILKSIELDEIYEIDKNYNYFMYLIYETHNLEKLERFFMDSSVYEFLDKIYFLQKYLKCKLWENSLIDSHVEQKTVILLHNVLLFYKSFEVEELNDNKKRLMIENVKRNKPKLNKKITDRTVENMLNYISNYRDRFLLQPITNVLSISFNFPNGCTCNKNNYEQIKFPFKNDKMCFCNKIEEILKNEKLLKKFVKMNCKQVGNKESEFNEFCFKQKYFECDRRGMSDIFNISLAKVINEYYNNINYIQEKDKIIKLLKLGMERVTDVKYLYLVYNYINKAVNYKEESSEGKGIKNCDEKNGEINDEIDVEEEDIDDEYDKNDAVEEEKGIEMENRGEMYDEAEHEMEEREGIVDLNSDDNNFEVKNDEEEERELADDLNNELINESNNDLTDDLIENSNEDSNEDLTENSNDDLADDLTKENINEKLENVTVDYAYEDYKTVNFDQICEEIPINNESNRISGKKEGEENMKEASDNESFDGEIPVQTYEFNSNNLEDFQNKNKFSDKKDALVGDGSLLETEQVHVNSKRSKLCLNIESKVDSSFISLIKTVLEANKHSKYRGGFKTGKKLNMRAVINYIASDYTKDKIWMKRTKNSYKYDFNIFIDNSKSMRDEELVSILGNTFGRLKSSLNYLGINLEVYKFGENLHKINENLSALDFSENTTDVSWMENPDFASAYNLILTDGIFSCSYKSNFAAIIIDKKNIKSMSRVTVIDESVVIEKYLDSFGLNYCIVNKKEDLEEKLLEAFKKLLFN